MSVSVQLFAFNSPIAKELKERVALLAAGKLDDPARPFVPSDYQQTIFDWIKNGRGSGIVKAVAGSGKTTTVIRGLAFIRGIDLTQVRAGTFHSVGYNAVLRKLGLKPNQVSPDGSKVRKLLRDRLGDVDYTMYGDFVSQLVGLAKGAGVGVLTPDVESAWYDLIAHHDLFLDEEDATEQRAVELARGALAWSNEVAKAGTIDFDDMLYLPLLWRLKLWQNNWVFIDEAQDTNPVRRALAKLALLPGGRLVAVGDDRQAIYGFTGASHDAMDLIRSEFDAKEMPLTVSYRCARAVVAKAQTIVDYLEASPTAPEGVVRSANLDQALTTLGPHDAILCRNTAPLIELAYALVARGVGCRVLGKEIGTGLVNLVKRQRASGIDKLMEKLEAYRDREVAKHQAKGEEGKAEAVADRVTCITTIIDHLDEKSRTVPALIARIENMFTDSNGVLTLSTQHKSKGREWDRVAILDPHRNPSRWARQDWQKKQEDNLMYVAWTRAKTELIFLDGPPSPPVVEGGAS